MAKGRNPGDHIRSMNIIKDDQDRLYDSARYAKRPDPRFDELGKYDRGLTPYHTPEQQEMIRAQTQTGWQALGNALGQSVAEVGLGTLEGLGYLLDFEQHAEIIAGSEKEFGNWFSDLMRAGKDKVREEMPVHGGEGFQPLNPRWWSKNLPSIASTLSLMLPAAGGVKALSTVGKGLGGLKMLSRLAKGDPKVAGNIASNLKGIQGAVLSRYMENTMEAAEVMDSEVQRLMQEGMSEEQAREEAGVSAANTWYANNVALLTDIPQYLMLFSPVKGLSKLSGSKNGRLDAIKDIGKTMLSEAGEEAYQYGVQQASTELGDATPGWLSSPANVIGKIAQQAPEYIEDPEFWTSVTLGAVGGGIFQTIGAVANERINKVNDQYRRMQEHLEKGELESAQRVAEEAAVDAAINEPEKVEDMLEAAEGVEDGERVNRTREIFDKVRVALNRRKGDALAAVKAKKEVIAELFSDAASRVQSKIDTIRPALPVKKAANSVDDILKEKIAVLKRKKKEFKGDAHATSVIDRMIKFLEESIAQPSEAVVEPVDLSKTPKAGEVKALINEEVDNLVAASVAVQELNLAESKPAEFVQKETERLKKEELDRFDAVEKTPENLNRTIEQATFAETREKALNQLSEKYNDELELVKALFFPSAGQTFEEWRKEVLDNNPFMAATEAADTDLRRLWNDSRKEEEEKVDYDPKVGDKIEVEGQTVTVEEVTEDAVKYSTKDIIGEVPLEAFGELIDGITATPTPVEDNRAETTPVEAVVEFEFNEGDKVSAYGHVYEIASQEIIDGKPFYRIFLLNGTTVQESVPESDLERYEEPDTTPDIAPDTVPEEEAALPAIDPRGNRENLRLITFDLLDNKEPNNRLESLLTDNFASPTENRNFIREYSERVGDGKVYYAVDPKAEWNQRDATNASDAVIHAVVTINGVNYSLGTVPAYSQKRANQYTPDVMEDIRNIRSHLWNKYQNREGDSLVFADTPVKVGEVMKGRFYNQKGNKGRSNVAAVAKYAKENPDKSFLPNNKVYLGLFRKGGEFYAPNIPEDILEKTIPNTYKPKDKNSSIGKPYILVKAPNGYYYWARVFTETVVEPRSYGNKLKEQILDKLSLAREAHKELLDYMASLPDTMSEAEKRKLRNEKYKEGEFEKVNEWVKNWKDIRQDIRDIVQWKVRDKSGNIKYEPDFRENLFFVTAYQDETGLFSPEMYFEKKAMGNKPSQIDIDKINTGTYNEDIGERLSSNLNLRHAFYNPAFVMDRFNPNSSVPTAPVEKVEEKEKPKLPTKGRKRRRKGGLDFTGGFKPRLISPVLPYEQINIDRAVKWLRSKLPSSVSIEVVDGLIRLNGYNAWGVSSNAAIKLSNVAASGTEYHEAFHIVFNNLLTAEERNAILKEARELGIEEDGNIEEGLAEEFRKYIQGIENESLGAKIKRFFKTLLEFIGLVKSNRPTIERLFKNINRGNFKSAPVYNSNFEMYRRVDNLTAGQVREFTQSSLYVFEEIRDYFALDYNEALSNEIDRNRILSTYVDEDGNPLPSVMNDLIGKYLKYLDGEFVGFNEGVFWEVVKGLRPDITNITEDGEVESDGNPRIGKLYREYLSELAGRGYDIRIRSANRTEMETFEEWNEEMEHREWWAISEISVSPKEKLTPRLKRWLSSIPIPNAEDKLGLGYTKFYSGNEIYPILQREIGNSVDVVDLLDRLSKSKIPVMKHILRQLEEADSNLLTQLFVHIGQKNHPAFKTILFNTDFEDKTTWRFINSNTLTLEKAILTEYSDDFNKEGLTDAINELRSALSNAEVKKAKRLEPNTFLNAFRKVGWNPPSEMEESLDMQSAYYLSIKLRDALRKNDIDFSTRFKEFIKEVKKFYPQDFQDTHFSVEGKKVYEWINSSFIGKMISKANSNWNEFVEHYKADPLYNHLPILKEQHELEFAVIDGIKRNGKRKGNSYENFSEKDMLSTMFAGFHNNGSIKEAYYTLPILSDSPTMAMIKMPKGKKLRGGVYDQIIELMRFEWERIKREDNTNVKNYERRRRTAELFKPFAEELEADVFNPAAILPKLEEHVDFLARVLVAKADKLDIKFDDTIVNDELFLREFVANHILNHAQLILLSTGDVAFYKNLPDFYKRSKEIWSPGIYVNQHNIYEDIDGNVHAVPHSMRFMVINEDDQLTKSEFYDTIRGIVGEELASGYGEDENGKGRVDIADGQTYIDLISLRHRMIGLGRWDDAKEAAFKVLVEGKTLLNKDVRKINKNNKRLIRELEAKESLTEEELDRMEELKASILPEESFDQPLKPYVFTHKMAENILSPLQKKDSEFTILPIYGVPGTPFYNPKFREYLELMGYDFENMRYDMSKRQVDGITFGSTIKVGDNADYEVSNIIDIPYEDWRLQQEVPEHHIQTKGNFGVQIMKLITADIDPTAEFTLPDGSAILGRYLIREYHKLIIDDVIASYEELTSSLLGSTPEETMNNIINIVREEVLNRDMSDQYLEALEMYDGKPNLPLWHPLHAEKIESLINSVFRKKVTDRKFKNGYTFVNTSAWGFEKKPKLKFSEDGKRLLAMEAYIPMPRKDLRKYANKDGIVDEAGMNRLRKDIKRGAYPNILRGITYRIPTEDKYSMFNIEVIGFLPSDAGAIILPEEVTRIAGLDFDIDKVFGFFYGGVPKFDKEQKNELRGIQNAIREHYQSLPDNMQESWKELHDSLKELDEIQQNKFTGESRKKIREGLREEDLELFDSLSEEELSRINESRYTKGDNPLTEQYPDNYAKVASIKNTITAYNVALQELYEGIREQIEELKELGATGPSLRRLLEEKREEFAKGEYVEMTEQVERDNRKIDLMRAILESERGAQISLSPGNFDRIKANNKTILDIQDTSELRDFTDPTTLVTIQQRMMAGKALIGFAANYNSAHALWQQWGDVLEIEGFIVDDNTGNKKLYNNLAATYDAYGNFVTKNISEPLAAFVDNGKDPQAEYFNMNLFTADLGLTMLSTGVPLDIVQFFLAQPSLKQLSKKYFNLGGDFNAKNTVIEEALSQYGMERNDLKKFTPISLNRESLIKGLADSPDMQKEVVLSFIKWMSTASNVSKFVAATKVADAGVGPTQAHNITKIMKWEDVHSIKNANEFLSDYENYITTLYEKGVKEANAFIVHHAKFLNLDSDSFRFWLDFTSAEKGFPLNADEITGITRDTMDFLATGFKFFRPIEEEKLGEIISNLEVVKDHVGENKFLDRLYVDEGQIRFKAVTGTDFSEEQEIREAWEDLFFDESTVQDDFKVSDYAKDLVKYTFSRNGFKFGFNTFSHLQPVSFYATLEDSRGETFNDYMEKRIRSFPYEKESFLNFKNQYIMNNFPRLSWIKSVRHGENISEPNVSAVLYGKGNTPEAIDLGENLDQWTFIHSDVKYTPDFIKFKHRGNWLLFQNRPDWGVGIYQRVQVPSKWDGNKRLYQKYDPRDNTIVMGNEAEFERLMKGYEPREDQSESSSQPDLGDDNPLRDNCNKNGLRK